MQAAKAAKAGKREKDAYFFGVELLYGDFQATIPGKNCVTST